MEVHKRVDERIADLVAQDIAVISAAHIPIVARPACLPRLTRPRHGKGTMTDTASGNAPYRRFAALYDALLGDRSFPDMRLSFEWIRNRYSVRFASAADIGCGTGTFVEYLCRVGSGPVWGVDLSPQMLEVAAVKNVGNRAKFLLQDMRQLRLPQTVDLVTCQFEALNYLTTTDDLHSALVSFGRALTPGVGGL